MRRYDANVEEERKSNMNGEGGKTRGRRW